MPGPSAPTRWSDGVTGSCISACSSRRWPWRSPRVRRSRGRSTATAHASACRHFGSTQAPKLSHREASRSIGCLINRARHRHGVSHLNANRRLGKAAERHTDYMKRHRCFSHRCPGEGSVLARLEASQLHRLRPARLERMARTLPGAPATGERRSRSSSPGCTARRTGQTSSIPSSATSASASLAATPEGRAAATVASTRPTSVCDDASGDRSPCCFTARPNL